MKRPDIEAMEARAGAATEGPWETKGRRPYIMATTRPHTRSQRGCMVFAGTPTGGNGWPDAAPGNGYCNPQANAEFIAHARQDVPALIEYVKWLEAQNAELLRKLTAGSVIKLENL